MPKARAPRQPRDATVAATKAAQATYVAAMPLKHRIAVAKSFTGGLTPRQAIRVKCLTCSAFDRDEVTSCRVVTCPLWAIRPYRSPKEKAAPLGAAEKEANEPAV